MKVGIIELDITAGLELVAEGEFFRSDLVLAFYAPRAHLRAESCILTGPHTYDARLPCRPLQTQELLLLGGELVVVNDAFVVKRRELC